MVGRARSVCTEQMLMILPRPRGIMCRAASRPTRNALVRSVEMTRSQSATSSSSIGTRCWMPALLTRMSSGPTFSSTQAMPRAAPVSLVTSKAQLCTRPGA